MAQTTPSDPIPTYTIDLSQPPGSRYQEVAHDFGPRMRSLEYLFDEILACILPSSLLRWIATRASKMALRRVHSAEETLELQGISRVTGVELYLLVALNNLLDCLLGCTSGAALVTPSSRNRKGQNSDTHGIRLMHFRTLDWGMDELRDLLVVLEFIDSQSSGTRVIARSVTYAGFVGSLTAVRENLSISLNFRPNHACATRSLRSHQILVLLGYRRSIGSILRSTILDSTSDHGTLLANQLALEGHAKRLVGIKAPPCYLILCDGNQVAAIEKDLNVGRVRSSTEFISQTNHDVDHPVTPNPKACAQSSVLGNEEWLEESTDRRDRLERKWTTHLEKIQSRASRGKASGSKVDGDSGSGDGDALRPSVDEPTLRRWLRASPTTNECTHFACLLDPRTGQIRWIQRGPVGS
ncbi:beta subunit of N-acylethanolamine-hydrolyzing acid amidase-domain-containing protein [Xylariales sp. AK1849]|nr:beta subunit of N-acylethanolamine-hydrolyzing acid amidase-domain-containing protein [Xylariales sp. AK1849]